MFRRTENGDFPKKYFFGEKISVQSCSSEFTAESPTYQPERISGLVGSLQISLTASFFIGWQIAAISTKYNTSTVCSFIGFFVFTFIIKMGNDEGACYWNCQGGRVEEAMHKFCTLLFSRDRYHSVTMYNFRGKYILLTKVPWFDSCFNNCLFLLLWLDYLCC